MGYVLTVLRIRAAFEKAGIQFTEDESGGIGVRLLRSPEVSARRAVEAAGVDFFDENGGGAGVRLRPPKRSRSRG
jgi:hypothetical protein